VVSGHELILISCPHVREGLTGSSHVRPPQSIRGVRTSSKKQDAQRNIDRCTTEIVLGGAKNVTCLKESSNALHVFKRGEVKLRPIFCLAACRWLKIARVACAAPPFIDKGAIDKPLLFTYSPTYCKAKRPAVVSFSSITLPYTYDKVRITSVQGLDDLMWRLEDPWMTVLTGETGIALSTFGGCWHVYQQPRPPRAYTAAPILATHERTSTDSSCHPEHTRLHPSDDLSVLPTTSMHVATAYSVPRILVSRSALPPTSFHM
jgi:hypothetical protein